MINLYQNGFQKLKILFDNRDLLLRRIFTTEPSFTNCDCDSSEEQQILGQPAPQPGRGVFLPAQGSDRRLQVQHRHSRLLQQQKDLSSTAGPLKEELLQVLSVQHSQEMPLLGYVP